MNIPPPTGASEFTFDRGEASTTFDRGEANTTPDRGWCAEGARLGAAAYPPLRGARAAALF